jgi:hypothetical protein
MPLIILARGDSFAPDECKSGGAMESMGIIQGLAAPAERTSACGAWRHGCKRLITKDLTDVQTCEIVWEIEKDLRGFVKRTGR